MVLLVLFAPGAAAQDAGLPMVSGLHADAGNQRVHLTWDAVQDPRVQDYHVVVLQNGETMRTANTTSPAFDYFGTNGQTYVFQVAARDANGTLGPLSNPVAATPRLGRDLQYLAAGLVVTWVAILGYAGLLARQEARLSGKLEQLLQQEQRRQQP